MNPSISSGVSKEWLGLLRVRVFVSFSLEAGGMGCDMVAIESCCSISVVFCGLISVLLHVLVV